MLRSCMVLSVLQAFGKQEVQQAIFEVTRNPMAIVNYQDNAEIMMVSSAPGRISVHAFSYVPYCCCHLCH